ncbi:MAG: hypothetical protein WC028_29080 [Candidatus Obscuribacterales bacterium]|jgi:hypothetical protein
MLDVRLPIGWLFLVLGVMLAVYGYANPPAESLRLGQVLLPLNLDVPWGILMALFGIAMVSLAQIDKLKALEKELRDSRAEVGSGSAVAAESESGAT